MTHATGLLIGYLAISVCLGYSQTNGGFDLNSVGTAADHPSCPSVKYLPDPQDDVINEMFSKFRHYRLVIGAGVFQDDPAHNNRPFVASTAALVDERLDELGYRPLPSLANGAVHYLADSHATKDAIRAAIKEMAAVTSGTDFGVIYWIGHGNASPGGDDLVLSVYDREVNQDEGYHFSDIVGELSLSQYKSTVDQIPHIFIILDACLSGVIAQAAQSGLIDTGGLQRLALISGPGPIIPPKIALLTATAAGADDDSFQLENTGMSAFGYFLARALTEDWECSDSESRDGVLTLYELKNYLKKELDAAFKAGAISAPMSPSILEKDQHKFFAFRPEKYSEPGIRSEIDPLDVQVPEGSIATIQIPSASISVSCASGQICKIPISKTYEDQPMTITVGELSSVDLPLRWDAYSPSMYPQHSTGLGGWQGSGSSTAASVYLHTKDVDLMHQQTTYNEGDNHGNESLPGSVYVSPAQITVTLKSLRQGSVTLGGAVISLK